MRRVLVTGAGHGIGEATARAFALAGDDVIVSDIDGDAAGRVANDIAAAGGTSTAHVLDVADPTAWQRLSDELRRDDRAPSVLINNAYMLVDAAAHDLSEVDWNRQISVTLSAVYRSMHTFSDSVSAASGCVVNVSSVHALVSWPMRPAYAAAKGGMVALTRQLSVDYAPRVRVNCVIPGSILTRVWDASDADELRAAERQASLGRLGRPHEVAAAILFLASDSASYITGTSLVVDGGQTSSVTDAT